MSTANGVGAILIGMSDQIGRHDATGPLARDADGRVDPEGYVRSALQGRELLLMHGVLLVVYGVLLLARNFGVQGGFIMLGALMVMDLVIVCAIRCSRWWGERSRRRSGRPPSWSARLFVLQARTQGVDIPAMIGSDSRLPGRLSDCGDQWVWAPARSARTKGVQSISLAPRWIPRVTEHIGSHGIATFDTPSDDGPRFDFWVGRRRDLEHHLAR